MRRTAALPVSEEDRGVLLSWLGSAVLSARMRARARIVLASAGGQGARAIARDLGVSAETIYLWRRRYQDQGLEGLRSLSLPGRRSQIDGRRAGAILRAGRARHAGGKARSVAEVARAAGVSRATVRRLWEQQGLDPPLRGPGPAKVGRSSTADGELSAAAAQPEAREPPAAVASAGAGSIVGIFIDLPWRALVRVAPGLLDGPGGDTLRRRKRGGRGEASPASGAILTALEAFGGDASTRGLASRERERGRGRARDDVLVRLRRVAPGARLEILESAPRGAARLRPTVTALGAGAGTSGAARLRFVRARTRGAWLSRATNWLGVAPRAQEPALAAALGHLMDYFAAWSTESAPFVWMPAEHARPGAWSPARSPARAGERQPGG